MNLGWTELLLIAGIALLIFGPSKLPGLGRSVGEAIRGFKKGISEMNDEKDAIEQISQNRKKPLNQEETESEKNKNS